VVLFKGKINILSFIEFLDFSINKMICFLLLIQRKTISVTEIFETQNKKASTQRYRNLSLLKKFRRFLTSDSCGLPLETGYLDNL
jgi:hypothetical protein